MNEDDLFAAYSRSRLIVPAALTDEERRKNVRHAIEAAYRMGFVVCEVDGCPTLIARQVDRFICRFHAQSGGVIHSAVESGLLSKTE